MYCDLLSGQALDLLVPLSLTRCRAYTCSLSTSCSLRRLTDVFAYIVGNLFLRPASRLDAFSAYQSQT